MKYGLLSIFFIALAAGGRAEVIHAPEAMPLAGPMVADISQTQVQIHSSFTGTQLLVFGARNTRGDLVIAVRGPEAYAMLRRKERIAGMWMHVERRKYPHLPMFYALAASRPLKQVAAAATLQRLGLGEKQVIAAASNSGVNPIFDRALSDIMAQRRVWQIPFDRITYFGESLFKAQLTLPDTLPRGNYTVEVYLFNDGKPTSFQTIPLTVYKTGMDAYISDQTGEHPWLYGLCAILMALFGGWLAHRLFHRN